MIKPLNREPRRLTGWHDGLTGSPHPRLWGNCSGLWGDCTDLWGNCSGLWGNLDKIPTSARPCSIADWVEEESC